MSDKDKQQRYLAISKQITEQIGGKDNIVASTHCATRLRIVLKDYDKINKEGIDNIDLVKGEFVAGNQLQIIFGAGLVNEIYEVFSAYTGTAGSSMADVKQEAAKKMNPLQAVIKSLSDVFVDIMPGILAAALLSGLTGVLSQWDVVAGNATLFGINRLVSLASNGIFSILPLAVCYSACKRYGGKPILGLVMGAIMLDGSLANAYDAAQGLVQPDSISLFGLNIELVGFQGGIIIALMMGFIVAKLDIFFDKKIPDVVKLLFSPMCSVLISTVLLFTIVGPAGRLLSNGITNGLIWMTQNLGLLGYMVFGGVQQIIVITGLHHIFGAIEAQLLSDTGRNFLNPLMSVALMGQGGAGPLAARLLPDAAGRHAGRPQRPVPGGGHLPYLLCHLAAGLPGCRPHPLRVGALYHKGFHPLPAGTHRHLSRRPPRPRRRVQRVGAGKGRKTVPVLHRQRPPPGRF